MKKYKLWYIITDFGDGSAAPEFFADKESAEDAAEYDENNGNIPLCGPEDLELTIIDGVPHFSKSIWDDDMNIVNKEFKLKD